MLNIFSTSNHSYKLTQREYINLKRLADYSSVQSMPEIWRLVQERFGQTIALMDSHAEPEVVLTYSQLYQQIQLFAAGLQALGVQPGVGEAGVKSPHVALFADNSPRWLIADQGIMTAGAVNVVRSSQAAWEELLYILIDSDSTALVVENCATLKKLYPHLDALPIRLVVLLSDEDPDEKETLKILNYQMLIAAGSNYSQKTVNQNRDTLATLIYTSGTTGKPKGVMLNHGNLLHQITTFGVAIQPQPGACVLSVLPPWHIYERTMEYFFLSQGCTQIYTNNRYFKQDLKKFQPNYVAGVPRLWDYIYERVQKQFREQPPNKQRLINFLLTNSQYYIEARRMVQRLALNHLYRSPLLSLIAGIQTVARWSLHALAKQLVYRQVRSTIGGQIEQVISGGASLAMHLENFFEILGIEILVGYGLTETSPVISVRRRWRNLRGSAGQPIPGTEIKIVDIETRQPLPVGQCGLVLVRGPQVMQGYYKNPEATANAIDLAGWFDTGDLGWLTLDSDLVLTGRAKDTIVLTNGENIEPQPIEDACLRSPYIYQIMLVGQDRRSLGALIVPNREALQQWLASHNLYLRLGEQSSSLRNGNQGAKLTCSYEYPDCHSTEGIDLNSKIIYDLFRQELIREVQNQPSFRSNNIISSLRLIPEPFSIENGMMTQTMKIRRSVVIERYHDIIENMFSISELLPVPSAFTSVVTSGFSRSTLRQ
ncbi:AMP-binding protein [Scytonema hofmannii]|uniref:AMP-binding protein n=1 Tax=Scytonema hofmannii TaxID=34078 RepID=UPI00038246C7|nr:AMP-binding protein [Scytonema hofmannii]